jgi:Dual specificity phosphatase, catalytic domain/Rhodanese-like domain
MNSSAVVGPATRSSIAVQAKRARPPNLALSPPTKRSNTTPTVLELDTSTSIDDIDRHSLHSPVYATPLSETEHTKSPDDISNQLAVLEQLRRSVQKNLRLRPIAVTPSPPRSPTRPLSSASNWPDFTQARSSSPASSIASPSIYYTPISDIKSPPPSAHFIGPAAFDRPGSEPPRSPARSIDPASLVTRLDNPVRRPLLIDTRPAAAYQGSHIKSSINFAIPSLILKRSRKPGAGFGSIDALRQFITTDPCRNAWDTLMAPGGSWDGDVIVYDEEMNPQDRMNAQVIAWALLPVISPLLVRGRADYLEGGMLAARAHPALQKYIVSFDNTSPQTLDSVQEEQHSVLSPPPPPPKLSFPSKPRKGGGLFQLDTVTAARSMTLPEIELSAGASPVQMLANFLPGNTESSSWNITDATPSPPPSESVFPSPPPRRPSMAPLRKIDTKSAERLGPPKLQVRTLRSATLAAPPSAPWPSGGGSGSPRAHSPSHLTLAYSNHTPPASARHGEFLLPPPSPNVPSSPGTPLPPSPRTARPDLSAPPSTEEAIPTFTVSTILPNFLYLGPEITAEEHVRELEDLGVRRILNIAIECDDDHGLGLRQRFERYVKIPMRDTVEEENIIQGVREACEVLGMFYLSSYPPSSTGLDAMADDASLHSAPTFVHCKAGKSRSVTAVMAYLIHANHWTLSRAYTFVLERRKGISPNIGFVSELMNFEETELGSKSVGVVKQPQSAGGGVGSGSDGVDPDEDRGAGMGIGGRRPSHTRESLPPAWGTSGASGTLPSVPRGVAGDVGQETEVKDASGRYRHARRAPVDENTLQPMRRVSKAGLESTTYIDP